MMGTSDSMNKCMNANNKKNRRVKQTRLPLLLVTVVVVLGLAATLLVGCAPAWGWGGSRGQATLTIIENPKKDWSENQPQPGTQTMTLKVGDTVLLEGFTDCKARFIVTHIGYDVLTLRFEAEGVGPINSGGGINMLSKENKWTAELVLGEDYRVAIKTTDAGVTWLLRFEG